MKSISFGFNAKMALAALAVCGLFASCYEKAEVDVTPTPTPEPAEYVIAGNITDAKTGELINGAAVTVDGASVTLENGFYKKEDLNDGPHIVTVTADGYKDATRTIYLAKVADGGTSFGNGDFALYGVGEEDVIAPDDPVNPLAPATEDQANAMLESQRTTIEEALAGIAGVGDFVLALDENNNTVATVPVTVAGAVGEPMQITIPSFSGFASNILPESDNLFTKALTDGQIWLASAESLLNKNYGLTYKNVKYTIKGVAGQSIIGYTLKLIFLNKVLTFDGAEGVVMYQDSYTVEPVMESHDSHDTHDSHNIHGSNPGAGGGSSTNAN